VPSAPNAPPSQRVVFVPHEGSHGGPCSHERGPDNRREKAPAMPRSGQACALLCWVVRRAWTCTPVVNAAWLATCMAAPPHGVRSFLSVRGCYTHWLRTFVLLLCYTFSTLKEGTQPTRKSSESVCRFRLSRTKAAFLFHHCVAPARFWISGRASRSSQAAMLMPSFAAITRSARCSAFGKRNRTGAQSRAFAALSLRTFGMCQILNKQKNAVDQRLTAPAHGALLRCVPAHLGR
jgi:hypothetical protein